MIRDQLAFDEQAVEDAALENALERREKERQALNGVRLRYEKADEAAKVEIGKQELPEGVVLRVGRFRIERVETPGSSVSFERKASSRIRIALVKER